MRDGVPEVEIPIYSEGEILATLNRRGGQAKVSCLRCGYTIVDNGNIEDVLSQFWLHLTFEHEGPVEPIGVSNLDQISPSGIRLTIQIVVLPK